MNLKERIEKITRFVIPIFYVTGDYKDNKWVERESFRVCVKQLTTDILKAVTNHLCDKVDEMKKELYLYSSGEFASDKTETFNQALDEVKQMLKGEML